MSETPARILVVDDEVAHMTALCSTLEDSGFDVTGCHDGRLALGALERERFDLLLTDLTMPEIDGITLLREATSRDPDLVGIIMTGQGTIATAVEAMKTGAFDFIQKPFRLSAILPVLARALSIRQLRIDNAELQRNLATRTAELESANRELDAFASSIAHDLGAPVRYIQSYARDLLSDCGEALSERCRADLTTIIESSSRLATLIRDLLEFSRISRRELRRQSVDLDLLIAETRRSLEPEIRGREIRWTVSKLPTVEGDASLLRQVVWNLLSNALKYTRMRDVAEIGIEDVSSNGEHVIAIRDNGAGFDMKYAGKLFGVFQRLHSESVFEGSGVGLANVRRIIERHGGRTWAVGQPEHGATFHFSLPISRGTRG